MMRLSSLIFVCLVAPLAATSPIQRFKSCLPSSSRFPIHYPSSPKYGNLSTLNFRTDLSGPPAAILTATSERQIQTTLRCASKAGIQVCPRGGGHSFAGLGLCSGVVVDISNFRDVQFHGRYKVTIGAGLSSGEVLWKIWKQRKRWLSMGICPGIGISGFILGGGHGPYEGDMSILCDSVLALRVVTADGKLRIVNRSKGRDLFRAMCGMGGGHLGVVTAFRMKTKHSKRYDDATIFRFSWDHEKAGELLEKFVRYDEEGGRVWARAEVNLGRENGIQIYGACYGLSNEKGCVSLLEKSEVFRTPGRTTELVYRVRNAPDLQAFFGPSGGWSRYVAEDPEEALLNERYSEREDGNGRRYQSAFLKFEDGDRRDKTFWQTYANNCADGGATVPWATCHLNVFQGAVKETRDNVFAHREADLIALYMIGGGSEVEKDDMYDRMRTHVDGFTSGVYVNFPDLRLSEEEYPELYWGSFTEELGRTKQKYDPKNLFRHAQPVPTV